jgi:outer membrane protein assembly factor BamB
VVANPVFADGRLYFATGREPEFAGGPGRLFCIDPTKAGDVSPELEDGKGGGKPNPASALVWEFSRYGDKNTEVMHQTVSSVAVHGGLVIAPDRHGYVHCLDARTGKHQWSHETRGGLFGDPLMVGGKVYVGSDEGELTVLELAKTRRLLKVHELGNSIEASPVFANGTLYIQTRTVLYAVGAPR